MENPLKSVRNEIGKMRNRLIGLAHQKGHVWENFGQSEVWKLKDKYFQYQYAHNGVFEEIEEFNRWAMNYYI